MAAPESPLVQACSFLFVPGSRPDRFDKALASGAEVVVLDLEDAVAPAEKGTALRHVAEWLEQGNRAVVRINGHGTPWHAEELSTLARVVCDVMVPKAEDPDELANVAGHVGGRLVALVETPRGVRDVDAIAVAQGVERLALGTVDLAAGLGVDPASWPALAYARGRLVVASAAAGLPAPVDGVTTTLEDAEAVAVEARAARELGFGAKLCVHPRQVPEVNEAFRPSDDEVRWARRVVEASSASSGGVSVIDGAMVDAPVLLRAEGILRRSAQ